MDKVKNKIDTINILERRINKLEQFILLLEIGDATTEYKDNRGEFRCNQFTMMTVASNRWTGTDNPRLEKEINNPEDIVLASDLMKEGLRVQLKKLRTELEAKLV